MKAAVDAAVKQFEKLGAEIVEISLPHTDYGVAVYYIIATAEASANLARFDGIRYGARVDGADPVELYSRTRGAGFGAEVKRRIILGTYVLSSGYYDAYYLRAQKVRTLIRNDFLQAFEKVDAIVTPTTPTAAFKIGEKSDDPLQMYLSDIFTISCNLAGICGISVPCGFTQNPKLPIGLQLLGRPFGEETLLKIAHAYEQASLWHKERPAIVTHEPATESLAMKFMQRANKILFFIGLSLPLIALVVMSWLVHQTTGQFQESFYQVAHTYKVLNLVQQTQLHLLDAETERRGYLLTDGDDYLASYGRAMIIRPQ